MAVKTFRGFGGGRTDFYIGARDDQYEEAINLIVDQYSNLINRPGTALDFTSAIARARVPASVSTRRIGLLMEQELGATPAFVLLKQSGDALYYDNGSTMVELQGPGSASAFDLTSPVTSETAFSYAEWQKHTIITHESPFQKPVKVYRDDAGALQLRTAGLPKHAGGASATGGAGAAYIYAFVYKYTYNVGDVEYIDRSAPVFQEFTNIGTTTSSSNPAISLSNIASLANANGEHYDTSNLKIEIYRTRADATTLYYVAEINNGTTTYSDTTTDDALVLNSPIYTAGGEVGNDRPPKCKYVHATSDFTYYAHGIEVGFDAADLELLPQRFWQSKRGDADSVPADFYADIEEPITGISSVKSVPIVFGKNSAYRVDGTIDNFGRGALVPRKISDTVGCVGQLSIVQTIDGIYFAGSDGFYFTDGYRLQKLSDEFQDTYNDLINTDLKRKRLYGAINIDDGWVGWACTWDDNNEGTDNRRMFILDLRTRAFSTWGSGYNGTAPELETTGDISGTTISNIPDTTGVVAGQYVSSDGMNPDTYVVSVDSATQVTISSAGPAGTGVAITFIENNEDAVFYKQFRPTALLFADNTFWMGTANGFTKYFDTSIAVDPKIDESVSSGAVSFDELPLLYNYAGPASDLGTTEFRKWVNGVIIKARPRFDLTSDVAIQPQGENDDSGTPHSLEYILFQSFFPWGTLDVPYGDPRLYRRRSTMVDVKRRFPAGKMRCEYKQLRLKTGFVKKYESNFYSVATLASGSGLTRTLTLTDSEWPDNIKDYWITLGDDGYATNYRILSRDSASQITILDALGALTNGANKAWAIKAYLKTSLIQLIEYSMFYEVLGTSQAQYTGENGVNV